MAARGSDYLEIIVDSLVHESYYVCAISFAPP